MDIPPIHARACPTVERSRRTSGAGPALHRHLNDNAGYQPAAVDDIISRGLWQAWAEILRIKAVLILRMPAVRPSLT